MWICFSPERQKSHQRRGGDGWCGHNCARRKRQAGTWPARENSEKLPVVGSARQRTLEAGVAVTQVWKLRQNVSDRGRK